MKATWPSKTKWIGLILLVATVGAGTLWGTGQIDLNAIAGFHDITSGSIHLDGELLCGPGQPQATPDSDRIVVFQNAGCHEVEWKQVCPLDADCPSDRLDPSSEFPASLCLENGTPGEVHDWMIQRGNVQRGIQQTAMVHLV